MENSLTNPQNSIWLTEKFYSGTSINNISVYNYIAEPVNFNILSKAINEVVKLNDAMRIKVKEKNNSCIQYISEYVPFTIETIELTNEEEIKSTALQLAKIPFNIENNLLFKFTFFKLPNKNGGFFLCVHHIIGDSWSLGLVAKQIMLCYSDIKNNTYTTKDYPSYTSYIKDEKDYLESDKFKKDKKYWNDIFKTVPEVATIPSFQKQNNTSCNGDRLDFCLDSKLVEDINNFCKDKKVSLYNFFMSLYSLYLGRVSSLDDFVIGTPILNRTNFEQKNTMGMFISTAPLRIELNHNLSFTDFVKDVSVRTISLFRHQKYPYQYILEDLRTKDSSIPNLYNVVLSYQITKTFDEESKIKYTTGWLSNGCCADDIQIHLLDLNDDGKIHILYDYKTDKYSKQDIADLHSRILSMLNQVMSKNDVCLRDIEIVTPEEKHKILYDFNNTNVDYPKDKTIVDLFEEQVKKTPDNIAVVFEDQKLTYKELNEKANQLARYLIENNVKIGDIVSILLNKSMNMIISILSILKAGATFLPIDVEYPKERIDYIISNSTSKFIITDSQCNYNNFNSVTKFIIEDSNLQNLDTTNIGLVNSYNDAIYIMYTSGSTGKPKGVVVSNKNVVRLVKNNNFIKFNKHEHILQTGSIVFDACTFEIWGALLNGFELYIIKKEELLDIQLLKEYIIKNKITILWLTAPLFNQLCEENPSIFNSVRILLTGGDVLSPKHINMAKTNSPNLKIINGYGPTENTTFSCCYTINKLYNTSIPIGKPISNSTAYIVSNIGLLCPIGVPGELWVGGDGVSKGYLNNPELTKEKFIDNPFEKGTIYKTGDLVKWLPDGNIEFIGRIDNQVKVRGFRVELSEIDANILKYPNIKQSITIIQKVHNSKIICSYIVTDGLVDIHKLKNYLSGTLASYMIPSHIIALNKLPLNINGKVDRKQLPLPEISECKEKIINSRNNTDKIIISCLKNILDLSNISITDSFFDIGGDSLSAIALCSKLTNILGQNITVQDIFNNPIIMDLSDYIVNLKNSNIKVIPKHNKMDFYPLSAVQAGIYYASSLDSNSTLYNTAGGIIVDKELDFEKLETCLNTLIKRHEVLRSHFELKNDTVVQVIEDNIDFKLDIEAYSTDNLDKLYKNFIKPFDLSKAPLFRCKVVNLNTKSFILFDMHHIISDGVSLRIFIEELCSLYNEETLPVKNIDYTDFCLWEKAQFNTDEFKTKKDFWINKFKDEVPLLNMPTTFSRPSMQSFEGRDFRLTLPKEIFDKINIVAKSLNITPYMLMLSCYYVLLYKYTSQNDIVIGSPIVGRELRELADVLGMFVNTLALRNTVDSSLSFEDFSRDIKENCLEYFKNQSYPFDMLVRDLKIKRDTSRNPLFDTVFVYQNDGYPQFNINGVNSKYYTPKITTSKFDLTLEVIPNNGEYTLRFEYCTKLFDEKFIKRFSSHYVNILYSVLNDSKVKIANINMLSSDEREKILYKFNDIEEPTNNDTFIILFENQVKKHPDNIALICDNKSLTYSELNKKANSLAHFLIEHNVKQNDIIAVMTDRSLETIVCMLAISKAGAAFVNMDPTYPIERTTYYLNDCKAKCVLKQKHLNLPVKNFKEIYEIDLTNKDIYDKNTNNPNLNINLDSLSYIIYTSGSTGVPKGVVLNQLGLANMCKAMTLVLDYLKDGPNHAILSVTSTPFDIFVYEITVSLSHGMRVVLANNSEHRDPKLVDMLIRKYNVDVMTVTPSLMKINYDNREPNSALANVKNMVFGGEPLSEKFVHDLKALASDITIYNIYGPSEITVLSNVQNLDGEDKISIGPPILNTKIYVLDTDMNPLPIGLTGEIYIGGVQVGYGYLGKEDLTNQKFINNPFAPGKIFKSGDIGRWTEDGKLQCLGRIDHQIKLRGLRVELGEIEKLLEAIPEVDEAVVNKVTVDDKEALCAYYVLNSNIDEVLLRNTLREKLPYYMVPTYFMKLDKMPYSINRKIDRKALPIPTPTIVANKRNISTTSLNTIEDKLLFIWKNVLHTNEVDINDNFFDVGGDSIVAIQVQIEAVKLGINIEYSDIFKYPTIKQLSNNINKNECYDLTKFTNSNILDMLKNNNDKALSSIKKAKFKNVMIIGTTGYLGIHLIYEFLTTCKGNAYCLIRPKNNLSPEQRFKDMFIFYFGNKYYEKYKKRIVIVKGDITMDNLGLSNEDSELVINKVDTVINSGALVKHYGTSKLFEDINVHGTQNVVDFCMEYKKRLLHISTISVSGNGERLDDYDTTKLHKNTFTESDLDIGQQVTGIYTYTKFQAECVVLNAISNGLNAMIFRVGNVTNRFSDGMFQRNYNDNAFAKRIKAFIEIGAFPEYFLEHELELSPVDLCAKAIIKSLQYESKCTVLHIHNNKLLAIKTFLEVLSELNIKLVPVSNRLMADIITGILDDNKRKDIVSGIIYDLDKNKNLIYTSNITLNSNFSNRYLNKIGFYWKKTEKKYLRKCMKYFKNIGFINF
jgi:surfactin family lipopeptide synthetase B